MCAVAALPSPCAGWDIGGAHLKLALLDPGGRLLRAEQYATPLWEGLDSLERALAAAGPLPPGARHAVTMTGELVDLFPSRRDGVERLLEVFARHFPGRQAAVWGGDAGFLPFHAAGREPGRVASANWHATAMVAARALGRGILVDAGTTTTDIVPLEGGVPAPVGHNDMARLRSGELVYTGVVRTPVMAIVQRVPFRGRWQNVAAELFATMADVYRVTGDLDEGTDLWEAADGGEKDTRGSVRRLARMLGTDPDPAWPDGDWLRLAGFIAGRQLHMVELSLARVLSAHPRLKGATIVGTGCGRFLARRLAGRADAPYRDLEDLLGMPEAGQGAAMNCATAIAVALLAREQPFP